jgi:predicted permease
MARWDFLKRDKADREWREEMETHLQFLIDAHIAQGLTPEAARTAALKRTGNLTARREEIYRMNTIGWLDSVIGDLRYALRGLRNHPGFTVAAILTLAIGIGSNTAVFSIVNSVLLKPLPYPHSEELISMIQEAPGAGGVVAAGGLGLSPSMYFTYAEQNQTFQSIGAATGGPVTVTGFAEPEQAQALLVTDGLLQALAVPPQLGRWLLAGDQVPGATQTVVLSDGYWKRYFGGDRSVLGKTIVVDARPRVIVGVMPPGFRIADRAVDLIIPLQLDRSRAILAGFYLRALGRLRPGITIQQANADITRLIPIWMRSWPSVPAGTNGDQLAQSVYQSWRIAPGFRPLRDAVAGSVSGILWVIMGTLAIVMLIVCANVANLLLVRADARRQELAVRIALGAGRGRIVRQLLIESLLLGVTGGLLGLGIAGIVLRFLIEAGPSDLPRITEIGLDSRALAFNFGVALLSGFIFGLIPALKYAAAPASSVSLRDGGRGLSHSRERHRTRSVLVIAQVALALVLLIASGLMIRTFQAVRSVYPGFGVEHLQTFRVVIPPALIENEVQVAHLENDIADKLASIPGVSSVGYASALPMDGSPPDWDGILTEGQSYAEGGRPPMRMYRNTSPGFFGTIGARIVAGRDFTWTDLYDGRLCVLMSENLARELWGSASAALGKRVRTNDFAPWREVIGVVEDVHHAGVDVPSPPTVYWPAYGTIPYADVKAAIRNVAFVVRSNRAGNAVFATEARQAVWSLNASLPVADSQTMGEIAARSMARTAFTLTVLGIAGLMALALGLIGIYGVIAYAVSQRTREIGIRLALGAQPRAVRAMFMSHGMILCAAGMLLGLISAAGLTRLMKSVLFGVAPLDPVTFAGTAVLLIVVTLIANYIPARRASTIDPVRAMRVE